MEKTQRTYGDEELGYQVPVREMTPLQAGRYLEEAFTDNLIERMPRGRYRALKIRAGESE